MAKIFMVKRNGVLVGEFNGAQVKSLALSGKILPTDLIRESGSEKWVVANDAANVEFAVQRDEAAFESEVADGGVAGHRKSIDPTSSVTPAPMRRDSTAGDSSAARTSWLGVLGGLAAALTLVVIGFGLGAFVGNTSRGWYDYGNGMVNLDLVRGISGSCQISWKTVKFDQKSQQDAVTDFGSEVFNLNANSLIAVQAFISNLPADAKLIGEANVKFDNFTLTLLPLPETTEPALIFAKVREWQSDYVGIKLRATGNAGI